jgi:putative ABC transport system permease protein
VRNLIIEAKEPANDAALEKLRRVTQGLSFDDYRAIRKDVAGITAATPRKRFSPSEWIPKPQQDSPVVYGVDPDYEEIAGLSPVEGRFFNADENADAAPVCVLGSAAKLSLFGSADPIGKYV